ncbi:hypothetical protein C5F47_03430 [Nitrosopumilus cobalaminigenes]|uniref:Uncharacterized protein n=1 Tax=Nitrosopumilus cobalaminigenes TaxID=1470066 RepID=A0A7D5QZT4_9ARCH|nr:hypothetical protein [Nitrosopumilus cobalaminigenes]QLH02678.1 hypothetical protein C5F47_03430 [Nitrosopumilus cobalaminigenes]
MFESIRAFFRPPLDEEYLYTVSESSNDAEYDNFDELVTAFYKENRRLTYKLCKPIVSLHDDIFYCGVGKMPGKWIASAIQHKDKSFLVGKKPIKSLSLGSNIWDSKIYSRQQHLVESSTRHLMRRELEHFLGNCKYALTHYEQMVRISIPYDEQIMIFVNAKNDMIASWKSPVIDIVNHVKNGKLIKDKNTLKQKICFESDEQISKDETTDQISGMISLCQNIMNDLATDPQKKHVFIKRFFDVNDANDLEDILDDTFNPDKHTDKEFLKKVRYASIVSKECYPLARYVRDQDNMILTSYDELEHLVESVSRQRMRRKTIQYFGPVKFTFSVYEKIERLSIPLKDDYILFLTLDHDSENRENFIPNHLDVVFKFLEKFDPKILRTN